MFFVYFIGIVKMNKLVVGRIKRSKILDQIKKQEKKRARKK